MLKLIKSFMVVALLATLAVANEKLDIIPLKKAKGMYQAGSALFIDARGAKLYQKGTIAGSINIPVKKFSKMKKFLPNKKNAKIVTFCNGFKCEKSDELAVLLMEAGYTKVMIYKGGYPEWKEQKLPLMGLVKECSDKPKGPYKPKGEPVSINGAKVYMGADKTMIDQFWFEGELKKGKIPANVQLVDVRKPEQFKGGHIPGAVNIPWDSKAEKIDASKFPKDKLVVFYCNTGMMSTDAKGSLNEADTKNVLIFDANVNCDKEPCVIKANENL